MKYLSSDLQSVLNNCSFQELLSGRAKRTRKNVEFPHEVFNMSYFYQLECIANEERIGVYSSPTELDKSSVVVVPNNWQGIITAKPVKSLDELTVYAEYDDVPSIIQVVDLTEYNKQRKNESMKTKIERTMAKEMETLKNLETLKKFASKSPRFQKLYDEYSKFTENNELIDFSEVEDIEE